MAGSVTDNKNVKMVEQKDKSTQQLTVEDAYRVLAGLRPGPVTVPTR